MATLSIKDIKLAASIISFATQRGAFDTKETDAINDLVDRLNTFGNSVIAGAKSQPKCVQLELPLQGNQPISIFRHGAD